MQRLCPAGAVLLTLLALRPPGVGAQTLLARINTARAGLPALEWDGALARAAEAYARELRARGVLDHTGSGGERVVDRVRARGVTEARVGEILGTGRSEPAVVSAWMASPDHAGLILDPGWTHLGAGVSGDGTVWVVVFSARRVVDLVVARTAAGDVVSGRFTPTDVERPLLFVNLGRYEATSWDPADGRFRFDVARLDLDASYVRLGYVSMGGALRITNVLGTPRGISSSPEPAARP